MRLPFRTCTFLALLTIAVVVSACAPAESGPTAAPATHTPTVSLAPALTPSPVAPPITQTASAPTPSAAPTETGTPAPTPAPSATPTMLGDCAEIWQPGYYVMTNDFKTTPKRFNCMIVQSSDVVIDCDHHSVEGLNYAGYGFWIRKYNFPLLQTPNNVEIRNCKAFKGRAGLSADAGTNLYIHDNDFSGNYDDTDSRRFGIFLGLVEGGGIRLDNVHGARIENNTTNDQAIGIDVRDSTAVTITHNTAVNNSAWGVNFVRTTDSEISSNTLRNNVRWCTWGSGVVEPGCDAGGVMLQDAASRNVVKDNTISGQNGNGIFVKAHAMPCGDDNLIQNNKITDALYNGIELGFCRGNKIVGNVITGSGSTYVGVSFGFDSHTELRDNVISNMRNQGINSWNSRSLTLAGNQVTNSREGMLLYWSEWDPNQFGFLPPSPDNYASRDNSIEGNTLRDNSVAGIHLMNSIQDRVTGNTFSNNGKNVWVEGKNDGDVLGLGGTCSLGCTGSLASSSH